MAEQTTGMANKQPLLMLSLLWEGSRRRAVWQHLVSLECLAPSGGECLAEERVTVAHTLMYGAGNRNLAEGPVSFCAVQTSEAVLALARTTSQESAMYKQLSTHD